LLQQGTKRSLEGFTFYLGSSESGRARLGILVSRRHSPRATDRNRIKRSIREAFRLEQDRIGSLDVLVRPPYGARPSPRMILKLRDLFGKLGR
jgi:ribonuclease P protein component